MKQSELSPIEVLYATFIIVILFLLVAHLDYLQTL